MATPSQPTSAAGQHLDQGIPTPAGTTAHQGPATLDEIRDLLHFFGDAISELTRRISQNEEVTRDVRTTVENISQQVDSIATKVNEPRTPEQANPVQSVDETPRATTSTTGKRVTIAPTDPIRPWFRPQTPGTDDEGFSLFDGPDIKPLIPAPTSRSTSLGASAIPIRPTERSPSRTPGGTLKPIKVKAPEPFKGGSGTEAKQWLARMNGWLRLSATQFNSEEDVVTFLLVNMEGSASAWALPHLANMDWNDAALRAQFYKGLHWQVKQQLAQKETQPQDLKELIAASTRIDNVRRELEVSRPSRENRPKTAAIATTSRPANTGTPRVDSERLKSDPNYVSETERQRRRDEKLCIKCVEKLRIPTITLEQPRTVTMLDGSTPKTGKIWKKVALEFTYDHHTMQHEFLVSPIGHHSAILGIKWLEQEQPDIDWSSRQLSFPIPHSTFAHIAQEEEADEKPLEGILVQYHEFAKVFGEEEFNKLPPHRSYDIEIELTDEGPLNSPLYSMTDAESVTLKQWLEDELKAGKIRPSKSPISSPVMFVPKKDGSRRLVVDYRKLNARSKKNVYPLPRPDDLMSKLRGAKLFTKLDLRWGYNNVRVKEGDEWKTAFRTKYGLFETLVMPFGLSGAPGAFQAMMNEVFQDLLDVTVIIYLDDILIFSQDPSEHEEHVKEVLRRLQRMQLFCKGSKCEFHKTTVEYLGIIVSDKGFSLDKLKIQAVQEWPTPTTVKQVQSFLGFANFVRRFVANFSQIARPLHNLVKKEVKWQWTDKEETAFRELQRAIINAPVIVHADPSKPYFLETDASGAALGSVLSQRQEDGRLHPIGYLSESFKGAEQNYDTHDKELLAIIRSFEHWRIYLEGTTLPITVFTDHRNLEYWKESRTFNR
ncbi:Retrotransposable element Tf2 155 kDa protein type 1 [Rhizoctonia solani AG-1 IB]|uniref:Retrotransposable element Tf2 155 kDa protein type 1 n=2 Tax=Thanatephorus cucumeris (strain AG1-IB / isolate 7/3/14) TaxID=1108050 RepID=M5CCH0_THACB|nr:Retrotransposable element Tf2 155 kDa protein type 1 [Rhizoctonia solani AG-1 IB]